MSVDVGTVTVEMLAGYDLFQHVEFFQRRGDAPAGLFDVLYRLHQVISQRQGTRQLQQELGITRDDRQRVIDLVLNLRDRRMQLFRTSGMI